MTIGKVDDLPPALVHMLNILLDQSDVAQAFVATSEATVLEGYVTEMLRLDPPVQGVYREAKADETVDSASVNAGDLVYVDIASAGMNVSPQVFLYRQHFLQPSRSARLRNPRGLTILVPKSIISVAMF